MHACSTKRVLIVENEPRFRELLADYFENRGYEVILRETMGGLPDFAVTSWDYAVIDLKPGCSNSFRLLEEIRDKAPACRAVILTRYASIATAIKAIKLGAHDYLIKPIGAEAIERALLGDRVLSVDATNQEIEDAFLSLARHEREYIEDVLAQCNGNISAAARRLGIHRQSLQRKLRKYPPRK